MTMQALKILESNLYIEQSNILAEHMSIYWFHFYEVLLQLLVTNISNDLAKFAMPESYKTELTWSINARSLQNFLTLRTSKEALWEIRELAFHIFASIPKDHQFIFRDYLRDAWILKSP